MHTNSASRLSAPLSRRHSTTCERHGQAISGRPSLLFSYLETYLCTSAELSTGYGIGKSPSQRAQRYSMFFFRQIRRYNLNGAQIAYPQSCSLSTKTVYSFANSRGIQPKRSRLFRIQLLDIHSTKVFSSKDKLPDGIILHQ